MDIGLLRALRDCRRDEEILPEPFVARQEAIEVLAGSLASG